MRLLFMLRSSALEPYVLWRKPFNPKQCGKGWKVDEHVGQRLGGTLDARNIIVKDYLDIGERCMLGEERLRRIKASPADIQLDADDFRALFEEKHHTTLNWLYETKGITQLAFWGTILLEPSPHYNRMVLYLWWRGDVWHWSWHRIDDGFVAVKCPAAVLAS